MSSTSENLFWDLLKCGNKRKSEDDKLGEYEELTGFPSPTSENLGSVSSSWRWDAVLSWGRMTLLLSSQVSFCESLISRYGERSSYARKFVVDSSDLCVERKNSTQHFDGQRLWCASPPHRSNVMTIDGLRKCGPYPSVQASRYM